MNYGFVIDNRACIGCHACSTACKSENEVPLGVYRTWVKYTEAGTYPHTQRHFQVTRCNHCANPPCVRICPTAAMYQRDDGIVEFNGDHCIGCKACMQACPYDAIYIDPETQTAAKCHFCSHRLEVGLEPSCAVVCPTHAIVAGDIDDPTSKISRLLQREKVTVRKPEQGTAPKVFYIEGSDVNLTPGAAGDATDAMMFTDVQTPRVHRQADAPRTTLPVVNNQGVRLRAPQPQGLPAKGPLHMGQRRAAHMVQVGYNAQHKIPWHWPVPAYLVTKGIGAGIFMVVSALFWFELVPFDRLLALTAAIVATVMMLATTALLVYDLEKPQRFLYILLRPQWRSWLTRGAVALIGFSSAAAGWLGLELAASAGLLPESITAYLRTTLMLGGSGLAVFAAIYTAFLFGQAEGRDLWQSALLPIHLLVQAVMMGFATLAVLAPLLPFGADVGGFTSVGLLVLVLVDLAVLGLGEFAMPHASADAARAAHAITHGRYRLHFWLGALGLGHLLPLCLLLAGHGWASAVAGLCTIAGLYLYEYTFVMAPQEVPNS